MSRKLMCALVCLALIWLLLGCSLLGPKEAAQELPSPSPSTAPAPLPSGADYYPMAVGDYWVWRFTGGNGTTSESTTEVVGTTEIAGQVVLVVRTSWEVHDLDPYHPVRADEYYRVRNHSVAYFGCDVYSDDAILYYRERTGPGPEITWKLPFQVGQEYKHQITTSFQIRPDEGTDTGRYEHYHTSRSEEYYAVEATVPVDVPAGHFEECYRIRVTHTSLGLRGTVASTTTALNWFCPGVGWVKRTVIDYYTPDLLWGFESPIGEQRELIQYQFH